MIRFSKNILTFILTLSSLNAQVEEIGDSIFTIIKDGYSVNLPYFTNKPINYNDEEIVRVVIVLHGQNRNANDYFGYIEEASISSESENETLIFSPQFLIHQDIDYWGLDSSFVYWSGTTQWTGGDLSHSTSENPRLFFISSFAIMDSIVYNFLTTFDELDEIVLIGNSAGGQFVNRYLGGTNLENQGKVRYVVSAPSHYLYFDENRSLNDFETPINWGQPGGCDGYNDYRYGLNNLNDYMLQSLVDSIQLRYSRNNVYYLIGELDYGGTNYCQSNVQGENRFERARVYYQHLLNFFDNEIVSNHKIALISDVSHNAYDLFNSDCGIYSIFNYGSCSQLSNLIFPSANFDVYNNSGEYPLEVSFVNESSNGTHSIVSSIWDFGDQVVLNSNNLIESHTYNQPGQYNVSLTSYDIIGLSDSIELSSIIQIDTVFGDLNWDIAVNQDDVSLLLKHLVKRDTLTELQTRVGSVDGLSGVSTYDASLMLRFFENDIDSLPFIETDIISEGSLFSEDQNITDQEIITVPVYSDSLVNLYSFILKLTYDPSFLIFGSGYFGNLNDSGFVFETNSFEDTVIIAGSSSSPLNGNSLTFDLYFLPINDNVEETTVSFYDVVINQNTNLPAFNVVLESFLNIKNATKPKLLSLIHNYPNPFNSSTTITYNLNKDDYVEIYIIDIVGRQIKNLFSGNQREGIYNLTWDSKNSFGQEVSGGVYYYTIKTLKESVIKKMVLLR